MKNFLYILLIFPLNLLCAQTFQLDWKPKSNVNSYGENTVFVPSIQSEGAYLDRNNIAHFYFQEKSNGLDNFEIQNIQSREISKSDLGDIQISNLPNEPDFWIKNMKARNDYHKALDITGLYKNGNRIYQIISFEVIQINRPAPQTSTSRVQPSAVLNTLNGRFYKISIDTTGIYKIDKAFLRQNGIPTDFNPRNFKIYGNGGMMLPENPGDFRYNGLQENAIYAEGAEDGSFDDNDYFLFYAQGPNGIDRNVNTIFPVHSKHLYEDKAYYFINFESPGNGKRIQNIDINENSVESLGDFDQVLFYEKDIINIYNVGRQWFGQNLARDNNLNIEFDYPGNIVGPGRLEYRAVGVNAGNTSINVSVNGANVASNNFAAGANSQFEVTQRNEEFTASYPLRIEVNLNNSSNPAANVYFDYVRLSFKQSLDFHSSALGFRWLRNLNENTVYEFQISGNPQWVWDVSDRTNAKNLTGENGSFKFRTGSSNFKNEFIAFNQDQFLLPKFEGSINNQSLSTLSNIDYVIVSHPDFISQSQRLASAHEQYNNVSTAVVTTTEIYNEFSSGSQDISAIRDFLKMLYEHGDLRYALLMGDGSYDFKDRIPNNSNFVPTYQSWTSIGLGTTFVSDDFYGMLDDTDVGVHPLQIDIAIGRLPAASQAEAKVLVDKTLSYFTHDSNFGSSFGDWRSKIMFVVDDDNPGPGNAFHRTVDQVSASFLEETEPAYTLRKLYIDAFLQEGSSGGLRYPAVTDAIVNGIETGTLLVNYFGHGGVNGWAQERIFTPNEIRGLTNFQQQYSRLPVFVTVTCDFTVWDIPQIVSGGELLIKNPNGGAVAMLTTSREIAVSYGLGINHRIIQRLFQEEGDRFLSIGEALRLAKLDFNLGDEGLSINLIGDPLISLARPSREITIDRINGEEADTFNETIRALDFVTIEGTVMNANNTSVDMGFQGEITGTLFDKEVEKTTLNNDGNIDVINYTEQVDAIYRGSTSVENGNYKLEFYVPKDINFDVGNGKLLLYTHNNQVDGMTYKNDILVGDINPNGVDDDEGPVVGLYMNNLNFANGGITDRNPYLLACVVDSTGINATGAGIGHDITFLMDGQIRSTTVLNEYFEGGDASPCINPNVRDFQKGRVLYKLNNLELGEHTITFRVWDINNNSTTETLDFVVMDNGDQKLHINRLLNWPNPFTTQTYFHFEHNCPDVLEVQVQVFTISGKLVKTIRQQVSSAPFREGYRTDKFGIPWDGLDDFGNKIGKGVYIYKTIVKGANPESCRGTASETEKLVILK